MSDTNKTLKQTVKSRLSDALDIELKELVADVDNSEVHLSLATAKEANDLGDEVQYTKKVKDTLVFTAQQFNLLVIDFLQLEQNKLFNSAFEQLVHDQEQYCGVGSSNQSQQAINTLFKDAAAGDNKALQLLKDISGLDFGEQAAELEQATLKPTTNNTFLISNVKSEKAIDKLIETVIRVALYPDDIATQADASITDLVDAFTAKNYNITVSASEDKVMNAITQRLEKHWKIDPDHIDAKKKPPTSMQSKLDELKNKLPNAPSPRP